MIVIHKKEIVYKIESIKDLEQFFIECGGCSHFIGFAPFLHNELDELIKNEEYSRNGLINKIRSFFKFKNLLQRDYYVERGYSSDDANHAVTLLQKANSKKHHDKNSKLPISEKRAKSHRCKEYWIAKGFSEEDAIKKVSDLQKRVTPRNKEYWIAKGFSEEDAIKKVSEYQAIGANAFAKKRKENPENYKGISNTSIEYWLKLGMSESEAKAKLKDRQTTFSLDKCIAKHGEVERRRNME